MLLKQQVMTETWPLLKEMLKNEEGKGSKSCLSLCEIFLFDQSNNWKQFCKPFTYF